MIEAGLGIYTVAIPAFLLGLLSIAEKIWPRRVLVLGRHPRWLTHGLFFLTNAVIGRVLSFIIVVGVAANWAAQSGFGLFNLTAWPWWFEALLAFVILDFAVWLQHVAMHRIPLLWRLHAVHHSDRDLDATTALRFHPFELIVSTFYKSALVALLGVPVLVALAFEVWLNANALFNHSNIKLPPRADMLIRQVLVTPDMHLVHHSVIRGSQQQNYGFALTIWDRIFGTYAADRSDQLIGLSGAQNTLPARWTWSMLQPFRDVS